jgi:hypothetical protein
MATPTQRQATFTVFVAALLLGAPAHAALVTDADGRPVGRGTDRTQVIGKGHDAACKVPPGKRVVAFNLARESKLADVIAWISPIICKSFLVREKTLAEDRRLTMVAPERMTPKEAYRFFLDALDAVGLGVEPSGRFLGIVEAGTVVMRGVAGDPTVTALVRLRDFLPEERVRLLNPRKGEVCDCIILPPDRVVITDLRSKIDRLLRRPLPIGH